MFILQMEHPVPDYNGWKKAFDSDPLKRQQSGVKSYRIYRELDNLKQVIIQLDFDSLGEAEEMHKALKQLWSKVQGTVMMNPQSRILEMTESNQY
jgi:hypothetical protein